MNTKETSGLIIALILPSRMPKESRFIIPVRPASYSRCSAPEDFTSRISDSTPLSLAVKEAVSSCVPLEILYICRPSGIRMSADNGSTVNSTSVIFQFRYSSTEIEPTIEITPVNRLARCSEMSVLRIPVSFVIRLTLSPVRLSLK
ncbi:hypothetical protein D3C75_544310 [compost metagenome]